MTNSNFNFRMLSATNLFSALRVKCKQEKQKHSLTVWRTNIKNGPNNSNLEWENKTQFSLEKNATLYGKKLWAKFTLTQHIINT